MIDLLLSFETPAIWAAITTIGFVGLILLFFRLFLLPYTKNFLKLKEEITHQKLENEMIAQSIRTATVLEAIENEKERISKNLHDMLLPVLYTVKFAIEHAKEKKDINHQSLDNSVEQLVEASDNLKNIIYELSPGELDVVDLELAISKLINNFAKLHNLKIEVEDYFIPSDIEKKAALVVYRSLKELLTNVEKHAATKNVRVNIIDDDEGMLNITVKDDGVGFDYGKYTTGKPRLGYGLSNIIEKVNYLKGKYKINTAPGKGTEVIIAIPF
jgi:signal transduction histidine kinase